MKVLLSAYACEPGVGSEAGIGWNWVRQIARRNECVLLTRENNVGAIQAAAAAEGLTGLQVVGYDLPLWMRFWKRKSRGALAYFYLWQLGLARLARRLDRQHDFDLVQHLTFASSWIPSGLAFVNKPFVWGPVGQHPRIPARFLRDASLATRWGEACKAALKQLLLKTDPLLRWTVRRASRVLSLGSEFEAQKSLLRTARVERLEACGVEALVEGPKSGRRVLFSGRLVALKGPELALAAFALVHAEHPELEMVFLGEGPLAAVLKDQAKRLGVAGAVRFAGRLSHAEALEEMRRADYFLFPSFEGAGMVVPEAMAHGAVALCLDFGGPGDMLAGGRGLAVPLGKTQRETCELLAEGLCSLFRDPARCAQMRANATAWIREEMLWDAKGARLQGIFEAVLRERAEAKS